MVTDQDYELLSGYIDNVLTASESQALEARLAAEPTLRAELEALRGTVALLRGLPALKAPRNFTLTPALVARPEPKLALVPQRRAQPFYLSAVFSAAAAAAAIAMIGLSVILLNLNPSLRTTAPGAIALQPTLVAPLAADQEGAFNIVPLPTSTVAPLQAVSPTQMPTQAALPTQPADTFAAGAAAEAPTLTDAVMQQEAQDAPLPTLEPGAMFFSSEAPATPLPESAMMLMPETGDAAPATTEGGDQNAAAAPVDGVVAGNAASPTGTSATAAREAEVSSATPAPTQTPAAAATTTTFALPATALLGATMNPHGTPVAVLPPVEAPLPLAEAAPAPSATTTTTTNAALIRSLTLAALLGAALILGLIAVITTLLRRRAN